MDVEHTKNNENLSVEWLPSTWGWLVGGLVYWCVYLFVNYLMMSGVKVT